MADRETDDGWMQLVGLGARFPSNRHETRLLPERVARRKLLSGGGLLKVAVFLVLFNQKTPLRRGGILPPLDNRTTIWSLVGY